MVAPKALKGRHTLAQGDERERGALGRQWSNKEALKGRKTIQSNHGRRVPLTFNVGIKSRMTIVIITPTPYVVS